LTLTVLPIPSSTTQASICQGDYYIFNNMVYWDAGVYTAAFATAGACDSLAILELTVYSTAIQIEATICEGDTYTSNGETFSESGVYDIALVSNNGCDSIVTINLEVIPALQEVTATFCQGGFYLFGSEEYTEGGTYVQSLLDSSGCTTTYTLLLEELEIIEAEENIAADTGTGTGSIAILETNGGEAPYLYHWSTGETGAILLNLQAGDYQLTITDANGCYTVFAYTVPIMSAIHTLSELTFNMEVLPNLVAPGGIVYLKMQAMKSRMASLHLVNNIGQEQLLGQLEIGEIEQTFIFEAPKGAGMYYVFLKTEEEVKVLPLNVAY
jgi:hypothetical protein